MGRCAGPALAALAALAMCGPQPAAALPRPEDAALLVTTTAASVTSTSASSETPGPEPSTEQPASGVQVRSLHVLSEVQFRYAHTVVSSRVANPADVGQEVTFSVVLPETAFISSFVMEVDGKTYKAYVKEKEEAKKTYDAAVASGQTAAHVAVSARDSNSFTVSLNVEPQNKVSFNLTYEELLSRRLGLYEHVVTLNPGQVVRDLEVRVHIKENQKIQKLRVPEFTSGNKIDGDEQDCAEPQSCTQGNNMATVTKKSDYEVEVVFRPSEDDQREIMARLVEEKKKNAAGADASAAGGPLLLSGVEPSDDGDKTEGISGQFSVQYDVERAADGGEVVVNDGYFVHFFSPAELQPLRKHAIFVLDVSGSMDGRKIEQLREAMQAILGDLKEGDFFNLIAFSSDVKVLNLDKPEQSALYRPSRYHHYGADATAVEAEQEQPPPYRATKENIDKAKELVKQMSAYGGTNIHDALKTALECARGASRSAALSDAAQPVEPIILFLTDGDPTVGVTAPAQITAATSERNQRPRAAIFSLAFGEGADIRFLRRLSLANGGFARNIYEAADAAAQLKNFYRQIASPLLANVTFKYIPEKVELDSMTKLDFRTLFAGSELVVAGRTSDKGIAELDVRVEAVADDGTKASFSSKLVKIDEPLALWPDIERPLFNRTIHQEPHRASVLERLWAYLTIKQLLDKQDALDASTFKEEVITPSWARPSPPVAPPPPPVALPVEDPAASTAAPSTVATTAKPTVDVDLGLLNPEPKKKALQLALKYSFVTPLTSLVVVKPNETKATDAQTVNPADASSTSASHASGFAAFSSLGSANRFGVQYSLSAAGPAAASPWHSSSASSSAGASSFYFNAPMALPIAQMLPAPPPPGAGMAGMPSAGSTPLPFVAGAGASSATVAGLEASETEPVSHALATTTSSSATSAPERTANISDVKWLPEDAIQKGSVILQQDGANKTFIIALNETDPEPPQSCQIDGAASSGGICRHFSNCVLSQVLQKKDDFIKYQCTLGNYLAICCPPDAVPIHQPSKPSM